MLLTTSALIGQGQPVDDTIKADYKLADRLMKGFQNDSAIVVLTRLAKSLTDQKKLNSPIGLQVQLRFAEALEKDHRDEIAIEKLLAIADLSNQKEQWDVYINSQLSLARIHEKRNRPEKCLKDLDRAESVLTAQAVDSLYPRFAIRKSSYHRIYADQDSAIFYANRVLQTAPQYEQFEYNAVGNMLMGMLEFDRSFEKAKMHYLDAAAFWEKNGDFSGYGAMMSGLTHLHLKKRDLKKARTYNEKHLEAIVNAEKIGVDPGLGYAYALRTKARIFELEGRLDSALYYNQKGYQVEIRDINKNNDAKVFEIESKYLENRQAVQIEKQEAALQASRERRNWILALLCLTLLSGLLLTYYYVKLKKSNKKTVLQAAELSSVNKNLKTSLEQQIILKGELHHRVKNNIQVMLSMLDLQIEEINDEDAQKSMQVLSERLYSMSAIHDMLHQSDENGQLEFETYVSELCEHFGKMADDKFSFSFSTGIKNLCFNLATLSPLSIIMSELLMNSLKHAKPKDNKLEVSVAHQKNGSDHMITYSDNGVGFIDSKMEEREGGLGYYLIQSMTRQLQGTFETRNHNGAQFEIKFVEKQ